MTNPSYTDPDWADLFRQAGYLDFNSWWNAEKNLVESGNFRGSDANTSWSHVSKITLPSGQNIYLKRQQNHYPNNSLLKLRRILTFEIEWKNYLNFQKAGVPTMKIIRFAYRKQEGNRQAIIVSEELEGMSPIDKLVAYYETHGWPHKKDRYAILDALLAVIKKLHAAGIIHNALYSRHIYVNIPMIDGVPAPIPPEVHVALIDLERAKYPGKNSPKLIKNDLEKMFRRIPEWPARDGLYFLKKYLGISRLTPEAKSIARKIAKSRNR